MQTQPPKWVVNAIPAALSELHFGHPKRYTILAAVRDRYYDSLPDRNDSPSAKAVNLSMRKVREINPARVGTDYVLMGPDDKGIVDLVVAGYVGVHLYQKYGLPEEYRRGDQIATRVFWHNIFSGLAFHPDFGERYQLRIDDSSVFAATGEYLAETGRYDVWQDMGGEVEGFAGLNFTKYDPIVREMLIARCTTYLGECVEAMVYYKPVALAGNLAWLYGLRPLPPT